MLKVLFISVCLMALIVRVIYKSVNKKSIEGLFRKAKLKPEFADSLSHEIDLPYGKYEYVAFDLSEFKNKINHRTLGKYKIIDSFQIHHKLLLLTQCKFVDWGTDWKGDTGHIQKEQYHFFVVSNNMTEKKVRIFGEYYEGNNDKFMKTEFAELLIKDIQ